MGDHLRLHDLWAPAQTNELMSLGVAVEHIKEAYYAFRQSSVIKMDRNLPRADHERVINRVCESCKFLSHTCSSLLGHQSSPTNEQILIYGDDKNEEAGTTSVILMMMLQGEQLPVTVLEKDHGVSDSIQFESASVYSDWFGAGIRLGSI